MDISTDNHRRFRFSTKSLISAVTVIAVILGGWIFYSKYNIQQLLELREQGAIVIIRDRTPLALQRVGIQNLTPFFDVPTIELYITAIEDTAIVGDSDQPISRVEAQKEILAQVATARRYGAEDIQLILIDNFDHEWGMFAQENSLLTIGDSKPRYAKRLQANQETGANINP